MRATKELNMVLISQDLLERIRSVAELYAEREAARLSRADEQAWEGIRITDPVRYAARGKKVLVKEYYSDRGCTDNIHVDTIPQALEYIELCLARNGLDDDYSYQVYDINGKHIPTTIDWIAKVTVR
jgi:hypothetical protein